MNSFDSFNSSEFNRKSLEKKLQNLEPIHVAFLKRIYEHAKKQGCITSENTMSNGLAQFYPATELLKDLKIPTLDKTSFQQCINDLEVVGLIANVYDVPYKENAFALTELGLQAIIEIDG